MHTLIARDLREIDVRLLLAPLHVRGAILRHEPQVADHDVVQRADRLAKLELLGDLAAKVRLPR
jgi:hypothetical protein